jgi:hypothetical protein
MRGVTTRYNNIVPAFMGKVDTNNAIGRKVRCNERNMSSNSGGRPPPFLRSGRDKFKEGLYILSRAEGDTGKNDNVDKEFNLFDDIPEQQIEFRCGLPILVEVLSFGPLGASVAVIGKSHDANKPLADSSNPLAVGLIYQSDIRYFREGRGNVDVVLGEVLPAYVERVRDDGKIDVSLRVIGGRAKVDRWSDEVLNRLQELGELPLGNKSTPVEIARTFPGMSKSDFKKCIGALFVRKLVYPFPHVTLPYTEELAIEMAKRQEEEGSDDVGNDGSNYNRSNDNNSDMNRWNEGGFYNNSKDRRRN